MTYGELMMAITIWREARGEPMRGKIGVGEVIRNRRDDPRRWKDTIIEVVLQPWQFSSWNMFVRKEVFQILKGWTIFKGDPNAIKWPKEDDQSWLESLEAMSSVRADSQTTYGANHYHAKSVKPRWARGQSPVQVFGNHIFYKL